MPAPLPPLHPVDLASPEPLSAYLRAMTTVCPFIEPSAADGLLHAADVAPDCRTAADLHPRLFEQLVPQIERFRDARRSAAEPHRQLLTCHVIILRLSPPLDAAAVQQLRWPNLLGWSLKHLYTPVAVVLGFVRRGVADRSQSGVPIPVAPFHAVLIRSRVAATDAKFFPDGPLLPAMRSAHDDGRDVHAPILGTVPDVRDPAALRADGTYARYLRSWQTSLAKR